MPHTPAPWYLEYPEPYCLILTHGKNGRDIPGISLYLDDAPVPDYNAEAMANSCLVSAAPELLKECEHALEFIEAWASHESGRKSDPGYLNFRQRLQTAINKATKGRRKKQ